MAILGKSKQLKKELTLLNVYAIATGTTLSAGLFLLPGLAYAEVGPAIIFSYLLAAVPLIPAMFCMVELSTAMPRAGGTYYFLDRSMGPLVGTVGGLGVWLALMLKTSFALIGMGAYLNLFVQDIDIVPIAVSFAIVFAMINLVGAKESGTMQVALVSIILLILIWFLSTGLVQINPDMTTNLFEAGSSHIFATAGFVYISYVGVTNVASVAEEVKDPERNLPRGMFLGFATALLVYGLGTWVMVGVLGPKLGNSYTPMADAAFQFAGRPGMIIITIAAVFAFSSVANAGILSASRYPLAMSRDHLIPRFFSLLDKGGVPRRGIYITVASIVLCVVFLDAAKIAKLASSFQLLIFAMCCLAVIIMRESRIESYDPGFRSPFYPWLPLIGIITPFGLIGMMGWLSILFSAGLVALATAWYIGYARTRVSRGGAILHVFERWGQQRWDRLDPELRGILKEKGLRENDPFDALIAESQVIDLSQKIGFDQIIKQASELLAQQVPYSPKVIQDGLLQGTKIGATPVSHGMALPHLRLKNIDKSRLVLVRARAGIGVDLGEEFWGEHTPNGPIQAVFFLLSPDNNPRQHLRILAQIAELVDDDGFLAIWLDAENEQTLKETLLRDEHFISLVLHSGDKYAAMINKHLHEIEMPAGTLITIIRRGGTVLVPGGNSTLKENDQLTVIGDQNGIRKFHEMYK